MFSKLLTLAPVTQLPKRRQSHSDQFSAVSRNGYGIQPDSDLAWDGRERRNGEDRRLKDRREARREHPLDTRLGQDRRQHGRRLEDRLPSENAIYRSIKIRA